MGSKDRRPYLTATVLDQDFLDFCRDSLETSLNMIMELDAPESFARRVTVQNITIASPGVVEAEDHRLVVNQAVKFEDGGAATLPNELSFGTTYYCRDVNHENFEVSLTSGGPSIVTTGSFSGDVYVYEAFPVIRISDRNIFVGTSFYEALARFPVISRTLGEWLSPELEFSALRQTIANVDGRFNPILPSGDSYSGMVGRNLEVKLGLRDVVSTYTTIFRGEITEVGGFKRNIRSIELLSRDNFDKLNTSFPNTVLTKASFTNLADNKVGLTIPYILGDFTVNLNEGGNVPAFEVNGADDNMNGDISHSNNVQLIISNNDLSLFDTSNVWLKRGDQIYQFDSSDIVTIGAYPTSGAANARFEIIQNGATLVDGSAYTYETGDEFIVRVKGPALGGGSYDNNAVEQARKILTDFTSIATSDFDSNWDTYRAKSTPSQSAINSIKSRVWVQEQKTAMSYALSLLEQVRLEIFISRDQKLKINAIHFEDWDDSPSFRVRDHDLAKESLRLSVDEKTNFNRAKGFYDFDPLAGEMTKQTPIYRNQDSIDQTEREIGKQIEFPNLYIESDVVNQTKEIIKLASAYTELITTDLNWRSMLQDLGDFVKINVTIGSTDFEDVPCMIREIGVDPDEIAFPVKLWCFQLFPFQSYNPGFEGIVSSDTQTIDEE